MRRWLRSLHNDAHGSRAPFGSSLRSHLTCTPAAEACIRCHPLVAPRPRRPRRDRLRLAGRSLSACSRHAMGGLARPPHHGLTGFVAGLKAAGQGAREVAQPGPARRLALRLLRPVSQGRPREPQAPAVPSLAHVVPRRAGDPVPPHQVRRIRSAGSVPAACSRAISMTCSVVNRAFFMGPPRRRDGRPEAARCRVPSGGRGGRLPVPRRPGQRGTSALMSAASSTCFEAPRLAATSMARPRLELVIMLAGNTFASVGYAQPTAA